MATNKVGEASPVENGNEKSGLEFINSSFSLTIFYIYDISMGVVKSGGIMKNVFEIVIIDSNYCSFLRKYDNRVCYNAGSKKLRPFIGVLFKVKNNEYYAPLSSPKPKHSELKTL